MRGTVVILSVCVSVLILCYGPVNVQIKVSNIK